MGKTDVNVNWADQWLHDGDCKICRRRKYCAKTCRAHKTYVRAVLNTAIMEKMKLPYALIGESIMIHGEHRR